jgi:hypothetical protein
MILFIASHTVVSQSYSTDVGLEYVISGNDVLLKCGVPSHVADFVAVISWVDNEGNTFLQTNQSNSPDLCS